MYAVYMVQPDDRNHLMVYDDSNRRVAYIRVTGRDLQKLLRGDASFARIGVWGEDARKTLEEVARLFKENRIEYIIFKNYVGGINFRYRVEPRNIKIEVFGIRVEYILDLGNKIVRIVPTGTKVLVRERQRA